MENLTQIPTTTPPLKFDWRTQLQFCKSPPIEATGCLLVVVFSSCSISFRNFDMIVANSFALLIIGKCPLFIVSILVVF